MTFKQLEALYWIGELGSFALAAQKLHTSQSAVSKRVHELELAFDTALFDRTQRSARLTDKGEEMFMLAKGLLEQRDAAVEQFGRVEVIERRVRIGVTELTAMTWLPRWVELIQLHYPKVTLEPDVDSSVNLREKVLADELDLVIVPDAFADTRVPTKRVGQVESAWMCKPGLVDAGRPIRLHALARHRMLLQGTRSGTGLLYDSWMKNGLVRERDLAVTRPDRDGTAGLDLGQRVGLGRGVGADQGGRQGQRQGEQVLHVGASRVWKRGQAVILEAARPFKKRFNFIDLSSEKRCV